MKPIMTQDWHRLMAIALEQARLATDHGDVPIGAVVTGPDGDVLATEHNRREERADPTAHAEILALSAAARRRGGWRLDGCTLVVTLEPCAMCAGAAVNARVDRIVYGAPDLKAGAVLSLYNIGGDARLNHRCEIVDGVDAEACSDLLSAFFEQRR